MARRRSDRDRARRWLATAQASSPAACRGSEEPHMSGLTHDQLVTLVVAAAVFVLTLPAGFMLGRWWYSEPYEEPEPEPEMWADRNAGRFDSALPGEAMAVEVAPLASPGTLADLPPTDWEPEPGQDLYQWTHRDPIRHHEQSLTVIDWDKVSWVERITLLGWDEARRLEREGWEIVAGERDPDPPDWSVTIEVPEWAAA